MFVLSRVKVGLPLVEGTGKISLVYYGQTLPFIVKKDSNHDQLAQKRASLDNGDALTRQKPKGPSLNSAAE